VIGFKCELEDGFFNGSAQENLERAKRLESARSQRARVANFRMSWTNIPAVSVRLPNEKIIGAIRKTNAAISSHAARTV
jgi:hypothetical protein